MRAANAGAARCGDPGCDDDAFAKGAVDDCAQVNQQPAVPLRVADFEATVGRLDPAGVPDLVLPGDGVDVLSTGEMEVSLSTQQAALLLSGGVSVTADGCTEGNARAVAPQVSTAQFGAAPFGAGECPSTAKCCAVLYRSAPGSQCTQVPVWDFGSGWEHPGGFVPSVLSVAA